MSISPAQCRAARALLGWSQDDLSSHARIAKKSIADFEREVRNPQDRTVIALRAALEAFGVLFIPQNGGGAGVRFRLAMPRFLFRRDNVEDRGWIAFAFDYKGNRHIAFIYHQALALISLSSRHPLEVFDDNRERIMLVAAEMVDAGRFDPEGRVLINTGDVPRIAFDPEIPPLRHE